MLRQNCKLSVLIVLLLLTVATVSYGQGEPPATPPPEVPGQVVTPSETASSTSTVGKILENFGGDQKAIWTSPFHINRDNAKWWVIFGFGTAALIATDRTTEKAIPYSVTQTAYSKDVSQLGQEYVTLPIAAAFYLYGRNGNHPKSREVGVLGAEALLDSEILVNILKVAGGRQRPNQVGGNGDFFRGKGLNAGFPSGHAIETWTFASVIAHEYGPSKRVQFLVYGLASFVSVARFTGQFHYASDILAGGAMGWFVGTYVWNHHEDPAIHRRFGGAAALVPNRVSPIVMPSSHSYGVNLAWLK